MNEPSPTANLNLDLDRLSRCGFPEVVFGASKTVNEVVAAATRIADAHGQVLVTRAKPDALAALIHALPKGRAHPRSGCFCFGTPEPKYGPVAVVSAGTGDEPVAEEATVTLAARAVAVKRFRDCGVSGIHRILERLTEIRSCVAVVVIAGMEGALPSVVGGLVDAPVIGVPTSIGYGVAEGGRAALMSMLSSCAPGVTVVNIDNGFGAGYAAASIARKIAAHVEAKHRSAER
jgi:pyridinium-3,5-biscarboxylic acid mononucleotide synthase